MNYETRIAKTMVDTSDLFNLARGLDLYVVACLCTRHDLTMPIPGDVARVGFCDEDGAPAMRGDATHFGWTLR